MQDKMVNKDNKAKKLFCFGLSYSARHFIPHLPNDFCFIATTRQLDKVKIINQLGGEAILLNQKNDANKIKKALKETTHLLISAPPVSLPPLLSSSKTSLLSSLSSLSSSLPSSLSSLSSSSSSHPLPHLAHQVICPFLSFIKDLSYVPKLEWICYLSSTSIYGDHQGRWVCEMTKPCPTNQRAKNRLTAEKEWQALSEQHKIPLYIFRLAGIYGPHRNVIRRIKLGQAKNIEKKGHLFGRIHVEDIARCLLASLRHNQGGVYNICDDEPAEPQKVVLYGAKLLGVPPPPLVPFEKADLSPMARSFYSDSKKTSNKKVKTLLGVRFSYPDYRVGLKSLYEKGLF